MKYEQKFQEKICVGENMARFLKMTLSKMIFSTKQNKDFGNVSDITKLNILGVFFSAGSLGKKSPET